MAATRAKNGQKMWAQADQFQFEPLDNSRPNIRLFRLRSVTADGCLRLHVRNNVSLISESHSYRTLSYEWGPESPVQKVLINDKPFWLRENLCSFLHSLYKYHDGQKLGYIWADAICIDQSNVKERNQQVQQMKDIYSKAKAVLAWLGDDPHYAVSALYDRAVSHKSMMINGEKYNEYLPWTPTSGLQVEEIMSAGFSFCEQTYWTRLWIVQEIALACECEIVWGRYKINFAQILDMVTCEEPAFSTHTQNTRTSRDWVFGYLWDLRVGNNPQKLLRAIRYLGDLTCSVTHDKVYGFLGIFGDGQGLQVDYDIQIELLFLNVIKSAGQIWGPEDIYALAKALGISVSIGKECLHLCHRYEHVSQPSVTSTLCVPLKIKNPVAVLEDSGPCPDASPISCHSIIWSDHGTLSTSSNTYQRDHFLILRKLIQTLGVEGSFCQCSVCRNRLVEDNLTSLVKTKDSIELLSLSQPNRDTLLRAYLDVPIAYAVFENDEPNSTRRYVASFMDFDQTNYNGSGSGMIFYDPFCCDWDIKPAVDRDNGMFNTVGMPLVSLLTSVAHGFQRWQHDTSVKHSLVGVALRGGFS